MSDVWRTIPTLPRSESPEVWKTIPTKRWHYEVSSKGRARRDGKLKKQTNRAGHKYVKIQNKDFYVHVLVLSAFRPNPMPWFYTMVDHIDRDGTNNNIENLRWSNSQLNNLNRTRKPVDKLVPVKGILNPFKAAIGYNKKRLYLGHFKTAKESRARVNEAMKDAFEVLDYQMF